MKPILVASAAVLALCGSVLAGTVTRANGAFSAFASRFAASTPPWKGALTQPATMGSPFWNDPSDDTGVGGSHMMNVGDVLTDSGGLAGTNDVWGSDFVPDQFTASGGADPTAFNFLSSGTPFDLTLLFAESSLNTGNAAQGTVFGYYVGSTFTQIYNVGNTTSPMGTTMLDPTTSGNSYGFYATGGYGAGLNHFALFQLASGNFAMGFTAADALAGEDLGDFNDVVVEIEALPEPGTIGIMAIGLAALGCWGAGGGGGGGG